MSNLKLIRLIGVKANRYELAGCNPVRTISSADICAALSYSQMPDISYNLMRAYWLNDKQAQHEVARLLVDKHPIEHTKVSALQCAMVAVHEFCNTPYDYKPSYRNRAKLIKIAPTTYQRHHIDKLIDKYSSFIADYYATGCSKLGRQFAVLANDFIELE